MKHSRQRHSVHKKGPVTRLRGRSACHISTSSHHDRQLFPLAEHCHLLENRKFRCLDVRLQQRKGIPVLSNVPLFLTGWNATHDRRGAASNRRRALAYRAPKSRPQGEIHHDTDANSLSETEYRRIDIGGRFRTNEIDSWHRLILTSKRARGVLVPVEIPVAFAGQITWRGPALRTSQTMTHQHSRRYNLPQKSNATPIGPPPTCLPSWW